MKMWQSLKTFSPKTPSFSALGYYILHPRDKTDSSICAKEDKFHIDCNCPEEEMSLHFCIPLSILKDEGRKAKMGLDTDH
jgi:hypothetical protein